MCGNYDLAITLDEFFSAQLTALSIIVTVGWYKHSLSVLKYRLV